MHQWIGRIEWMFLKDRFDEVDPREWGIPESEVRSFEMLDAVCVIPKGTQFSATLIKAQSELSQLETLKKTLDQQRKEVTQKMKRLQEYIQQQGGKHDLEVRRP